MHAQGGGRPRPSHARTADVGRGGPPRVRLERWPSATHPRIRADPAGEPTGLQMSPTTPTPRGAMRRTRGDSRHVLGVRQTRSMVTTHLQTVDKLARDNGDDRPEPPEGRARRAPPRNDGRVPPARSGGALTANQRGWVGWAASRSSRSATARRRVSLLRTEAGYAPCVRYWLPRLLRIRGGWLLSQRRETSIMERFLGSRDTSGVLEGRWCLLQRRRSTSLMYPGACAWTSCAGKQFFGDFAFLKNSICMGKVNSLRGLTHAAIQDAARQLILHRAFRP